MSLLPSPLKSPTWTSTQVTLEFQVAQRLLVKELPLERAAHHWPFERTRPAMSLLPSPLKSPTLTSTQVTAVDHVVHSVVVNEWPVDRPTHHCPVPRMRPAMSLLPSPLKSPTTRSTHVTPGFHVAHVENANDDPFERPIDQVPPEALNSATSVRPSPLKSPESTVVGAGRGVAPITVSMRLTLAMSDCPSLAAISGVRAPVSSPTLFANSSSLRTAWSARPLSSAFAASSSLFPRSWARPFGRLSPLTCAASVASWSLAPRTWTVKAAGAETFPARSVAVHDTVVSPMPNTCGAAGMHARDGLGSRLSSAEAGYEATVAPAGPVATTVTSGAVTVGGVLSMSIPVNVALALFPALSVQVPVRAWSAPSLVTVWSAVTVATPEPPGSSTQS